ncbi:TniQ family protein [Streptomyces microflavus]|uniref:TniQ family protein n=1 Tax=Streptomyces microflavus TaxID=1919 RepID=UPI003402E2BA
MAGVWCCGKGVVGVVGTLRPLARLPRQPVWIRDETSASFLLRLAALNGFSFDELVRRLGAPGGLPEPDPEVEEVWLGAAARERLAQLCGRRMASVEQALPSLGGSRVTDRGRRQVRVEGWSEAELPVQACALCVAGRADRPVWRVSRDSWTVCVRHERWTGLGRGRVQVGLRGLPETADAHVRRLRLERASGAFARVLLADASQVAVYWWQCRQMGSKGVWRRRAAVLGVGREDLWAVPLLVYPEVVVLAEAMAVRERQRAVGRSFAGGPVGWATGRWVAWVGERLGLESEMREGGHRALEAWLMSHRNTVPVKDRLALPAPGKGYRRQPLALMAPHRKVPLFGPLEDVSCLPWRLGAPMTSVRARREGGEAMPARRP